MAMTQKNLKKKIEQLEMQISELTVRADVKISERMDKIRQIQLIDARIKETYETIDKLEKELEEKKNQLED